MGCISSAPASSESSAAPPTLPASLSLPSTVASSAAVAAATAAPPRRLSTPGGASQLPPSQPLAPLRTESTPLVDAPNSISSPSVISGGLSPLAVSVRVAKGTSVSVEQALHTLRAFDVVAFLGTATSSYVIEAIESLVGLGQGDWSHCGLVVNTEVLDIKNGVEGEWYLLEANALLGNHQAFDVERQSKHSGVQLRRLADVLREPSRAIAIAHLLQDPWTHASPAQRALIRHAFCDFHQQVRDASYDFNVFNLLSAANLEVAKSLSHAAVMHACDDDFKVAAGDGGVALYRADAVNVAASYRVGALDVKPPAALFCSQLCTLALQTIGVLPRTISARKVSPVALLGFTTDSDQQIATDSFFENPIYVDQSPRS